MFDPETEKLRKAVEKLNIRTTQTVCGRCQAFTYQTPIATHTYRLSTRSTESIAIIHVRYMCTACAQHWTSHFTVDRNGNPEKISEREIYELGYASTPSARIPITTPTVTIPPLSI